MLAELQRKLRAKEITSLALTEAALARIEAENGKLNAFLTVCGETALRDAEAADRRLAHGDAPPLCGIPVALKDNICTQGIRTTCASRMLADFLPPYSAFVWEKLHAAGAVLVGKTNMDEFAMGAGGETSAFGACRNPHDSDFVAGGSSGGSAAAVAAGMAAYALGSDTGGSVRVPASYCGTVGLKPTYGRISRRGLIAFASSLDQIGILTETVRDSIVVLAAVAGRDAGDATSADRPVDFTDALPDARGLRVGVLSDADMPACEDACAAVERASRLLEACGARLVRTEAVPYDLAYAAYYVISACEASSNLARYDGVRYGFTGCASDSFAGSFCSARGAFGDEVKRRILAGSAALSAENRGEAYDRAQQARCRITRLMRSALDTCDVLLTPTTPDTAYRIGAHTGEAVAYRFCDAFTVASSLAGLPAISVPAGVSDGLPLGVQLVAPAFREDILFRAALAVEEAMRHDVC